MKIEKITENQIKVVLAENEITRWSKVEDRKFPDIGAIITDLIATVEKETGVCFHDCKVVVEATQNSGGDYVLLLSRDVAAQKRTHLIRDRRFEKPKFPPKAVYEFEEIDDVCAFAAAYPLYADIFSGRNSLYSLNGKYYLEVNVPDNFSAYGYSLRGILSEFGTCASGTIIPYLLSEHSRCILKDNALKILLKTGE